MDQLITALELGLIFSFVSVAVYLAFRVSDFPDLTVDGSFTLGAAVMITLCNSGVPFYVGLLIALLAGLGAGLITALISIRIKVMPILSGILMMISLYSINLRIMGQPNLSLSFDLNLWPSNEGILLIAVILLWISLSFFLNTELGLALRAAGMNKTASRAFGISIDKMTMLNLSLSNGLVALAGGLYAGLEGYADISMGTGTLISGLASMMIGEALITTRSPTLRLVSVIAGSLIYRLAITISLNFPAIGIQASDINLITTALVLGTLILSKQSRRASC